MNADTKTKTAPEKVLLIGNTPSDLAEELDISPKSLRAWLRTNFSRPADAKGSRWVLTADQEKAARKHYTKPKTAE